MATFAPERVAGPSGRTLRWRPFLVGAAAGNLYGYSIGVSNDAIGLIDDQYSLSALAVGLVVSSLLAGGLLGCLIAGRAVEHHGHRLVLGTAGIVAAVGATVAALAPNAVTIGIGRLVLGVAVGVTTAVAPGYISEIARVGRRGMMMAGYQCAIALGFLLSLAVGALLTFGNYDWRLMFAANVVPALGQVAAMTLAPCSPYSLVARGRIDHARESLMATRNLDDVATELDRIIAVHQEKAPTTPEGAKASVRRPLTIAIVAALIDTLVGVGAIVYYSTSVFDMAGVGGRSGAQIASLSIGLINVVSTIVAVGLLGRYGRRPLLTVGLSGILVALVTAGFSLLWSSPMAWVMTITAMLVFMACHAFSAGPIGWLLVAEVLPARIRSRGSAAAIGANWSATLLVTLLFPVLVGSPGSPQRAAIGFFIFAAITVGFLVFVRVSVPETKGLTLAEVEAKLAAHNKKAQ